MAAGQVQATGPEQQTKMKLLNHELQRLPKHPNFISIASEVLSKGAIEGRAPFLSELVKNERSITWPLPVQLALGLAFSHSREPEVQADGQRFLKNKLGELAPNAYKTLPECLVHHLLYYIQTSDVFTQQAKILMQLESLRQNLLNLNPLNVSQKELQSCKKRRDDDLARLPANALEETSLAGVMEELGPGCTATVENFTAVLEQFPKLTAAAVGRAVGLMAMHNSNPAGQEGDATYQDTFYQTMVAIGAAAAAPVAVEERAFNVQNFVAVVKERVPEGIAFWRKALRALDFPGLRLSTLKGWTVLSLVMRAAGEAEMNIEPFLGEWSNGEVQLALITLFLQAPPDVVSFATPRMVPGRDASLPWASIDLVETLLAVTAPPLALKARQLFELRPGDKAGRPGAMAKHPDLLLLVLLAAKPYYSDLRRSLVKRLLTDMLVNPTQEVVDLLKSAAKEDTVDALSLGLADAFLETLNLSEAALAVAEQGEWVDMLVARCPSARLLSQFTLLISAKRSGPDDRVGGVAWLKRVFAMDVKVTPDLTTYAEMLLATVAGLPPGALPAPIGEIVDVLADPTTRVLSAARKQQAASLAQERAKAAEVASVVQASQADIEAEANQNFNHIYTQQVDVLTLIKQLQVYKQCPVGSKEHGVYLCMIRLLFDEFRSFEKYPERELKITANLLGEIVANNILNNKGLAHALKFVLQNLARRKEESDNLKNFSIWALDKFKHRLPEWPQYCTLLERVRDLEAKIPGIGEFIKQGGDRPAGAAPGQSPTSAGFPPGAAAPQSAAGMLPSHPGHAVPRGPSPSAGDAAVLNEQGINWPDRNVQERIVQVVNQIDAANLDQCVMQISKFLQREHYECFAEMLVVKRASLEPNYHKLYMSLLEKLANKELDTAVVQATYASIKKLLASDKIRTNTQERSLLKNLGSWLGLQTIGRNKPLMARDLDLKGLLFDAISKGRLIAVVPFVAKVLEHSATSKVFRPPNPWLMGVLTLLVDLYHLQDLKLTLKFEVEVLCKNIKLPISDIDSKGVRSAQREKLETIRKELQQTGELEHSTDFNPGKRTSQPTIDQAGGYLQPGMQHPADTPWMNMAHGQGQVMPSEQDSKMWADASKQQLQAQGRDMMQMGAGMMPPKPMMPAPAAEIPDVYRPEQLPELVSLPQGVHVRFKTYVGFAINSALKECSMVLLQKAVPIVCTLTRDLVIKDFATEPDEAKVRKAAQQMVKCLAAHFMMVSIYDTLRSTFRNHLKNFIQQNEGQVQDPAAMETMVSMNMEVGLHVVERIAVEMASKDINAELAKHFEERARFMATAEPGQPVDFLFPEHAPNAAFIKCLPEGLRPKDGLNRPQRNVYDDFGKMLRNLQPDREEVSPDQRKALAQLDANLKEIETAIIKHYQHVPPEGFDPRHVLSLTDKSFTSDIRSPQHDQIRKVLCQIPQLIKEETAVLFARHIFNKVFTFTDRLAQEQRTQQTNPARYHVVMFIKEVSLFIMQSARDKNADKIMEELTKLYINHDKKWVNKDIAVDFIRLRLINVPAFDRHLTEALQPATGEQSRLLVEFAGNIVQKCLVSEKLASQKDLRLTLDALNKVAARQGQQQTEQPGQPGQPQPPVPQVAAVPQAQTQQQQQQQAQPQQQASPVQPVQQAPVQQPPHSPHPQQPQPGTPVHQDPTASPSAQPAGVAASLPSSSGPPTPTAASQPVAQRPNTPLSAMAAASAERQGAGEGETQGLRPPTVRIPSLVNRPEIRDKVFRLMQDWVAICSRQQPASEPMQFVTKLQQAGMLKAESMLDKFFALLVEISVEDYCSEVKRLASVDESLAGADKTKTPNAKTHPQIYQCADAFADLVVLLIRCCGMSNGQRKEGEEDKPKDEGRSNAEVALANRVLSVVVKVLVHNHDFFANCTDAHHVTLGEGQEVQDEFKQQPYFRFLSSLLLALNPPQGAEAEAGHNADMLILFANVLYQLSPTRLPGFAFAWLELLCHRIFMPKLLLKNNEASPRLDGWSHFQRLLIDCLKFLEPWMRSAQPTEPVRQFYKGTLKVLLVLLHDFPEFLCNYHLSFCDVIPPKCLQIRNVVLSSFPRHMKLPDPFTRNLKVDRLAEIKIAPTILSKFMDVLTDPDAPIPKQEVDAYLQGAAPRDWLASLPDRLKARKPQEGGSLYNVPLMHSLVLYVGMEALAAADGGDATSGENPTMTMYKSLVSNLDPEGRYYFVGALTNHLRFPNSHTHYFSCVILRLFLEHLPDHDQIQEQITRVLLERLIANRPHPWGLLITFIELVKNPVYNFWEKKNSFVYGSREIERLFEHVEKSCCSKPPAGGTF
eukprot:TRINITY_DN4419_c0_g2_i1.p1 TRINITY_DN4419_c0_g2~~TRINITY_DN4419_c0_g2_i1.p1  ORF type:complete len:2415 (+),score=1098.98 TRINITY_DN4419_c0_g2_i1:311-7246(+)